MPDELRAAIVLFASLLDERQRRLYAGLESLKCGWGGDARIAGLLGIDPGTVARGRKQLLAQDIKRERVRRPGGGRPRVEKNARGDRRHRSGLAARRYRLSLPQRRLQVEPHRPSPVQRDQKELGRPPAALLPDDPQPHPHHHHGTGLCVTAQLVDQEYPKGVKISDAQFASLAFEPHQVQPLRNYTIRPRS